jgi:hypothetical protein
MRLTSGVTRLDMERGVDVAADLSATAVLRVVPLVLVCCLVTDYGRRELSHACNDGIYSSLQGSHPERCAHTR